MNIDGHKLEEMVIGLITRHQPEIRRYILSLVPDRTLADDVTQETCLVLWRKASEYEPERAFLPWALTIAWYQIKAARRDGARDRLVFDDDVFELLAMEMRQSEESELGLSDALEECLEQLPKRHRELILARYQPGTSVKSLAAQSSKTPTAVSLVLLRIRKSLETCVLKKIRHA